MYLTPSENWKISRKKYLETCATYLRPPDPTGLWENFSFVCLSLWLQKKSKINIYVLQQYRSQTALLDEFVSLHLRNVAFEYKDIVTKPRFVTKPRKLQEWYAPAFFIYCDRIAISKRSTYGHYECTPENTRTLSRLWTNKELLMPFYACCRNCSQWCFLGCLLSNDNNQLRYLGFYKGVVAWEEGGLTRTRVTACEPITRISA